MFGRLSELFDAVMCTAVMHGHMHTNSLVFTAELLVLFAQLAELIV